MRHDVITRQFPVSEAEEEVPDNELDDNVDIEYNVNTNKYHSSVFSAIHSSYFILTQVTVKIFQEISIHV